MSNYWYLLKALTQFEPNACRHIEHPHHKGEATYLPTPTSKAYLPGYLFARNFSIPCLSTCFSAKPRLFLVFSHISPEKQVIMAPFTVSDETVAILQEQAANHIPDVPSPLWQQLIGKKIRIRSGPFMGHLAKIKSIHPDTSPINPRAGAEPRPSSIKPRAEAEPHHSSGIVKLRLYDTILGKAVHLSMCLEDL